MQSDLKILVELQQVEQRILALEAEITSLPRKMAAQDSKLGEARASVTRVEGALKQEEKTRRDCQNEVRSLRDKAAKYRAQTNNVKTNEQLHALEHEIAFAQQSIVAQEDRELLSMEKTEQLEADLTRAQQAANEQAQAVEWEKASALRVGQRDQQELKKVRGEREQLRTQANAELLSDYDRLTKGKKTAIAEVKDRQCQACHMGLRPAQFDQLRAGAIMHCESCGRIWYYDPANDAKLAAKEAGQWDLP